MFDAFIKVDGIPGESTDSKHKDWIEILSFHWGVEQPSGGTKSSVGALGRERTEHDDFSIVKAIDKASPKLFMACCDGTHIKEIKIERPSRAKLSPNESLKRTQEFDKRRDKFIAAIRKGNG